MDLRLQELEQKSIYYLRKARSDFKNIALLWDFSNESMVTLFLCRRAFFGKIPFHIVYAGGKNASGATHGLRERLKKEWGLNFIDLEEGIAVGEYNFKALILSLQSEGQSYISHFKDAEIVCPLSGWKEMDILKYIKSNQISVLDPDGVDRRIENLGGGTPETGNSKQNDDARITRQLRNMGYM